MTRIARVHDRQVPILTSGGGLGGSLPDPADTYITKIDGGLETVDAHGAAGATETVDLADGNWHSITLSADLTLTVTGFTTGLGCSAIFKFTQDGTGGWAVTWDPDVIFAGDDQPAQAAGAVSWFVLASDEGDSVIYGFPVGGTSLTAATTVEAETTFGIASAVGTDTEYARQDHTHGSPANPVSTSALEALGVIGAILISDDHSTPIVFADILLTEAGDDILYADLGG